MREIKFRAWDAEHKVMFAVWKLNCSNGPYKAMPESFYAMDFNKGLVDFSKCELMQYTGIKDKNGKEIYEGDVIEMYSDACLYSVGGVLEQRVVSWDNTRNGWNFLESRNYKCQIHSDEELSDTLEIIGNIYENPELKEKK